MVSKRGAMGLEGTSVRLRGVSGGLEPDTRVAMLSVMEVAWVLHHGRNGRGLGARITASFRNRQHTAGTAYHGLFARLRLKSCIHVSIYVRLQVFLIQLWWNVLASRRPVMDSVAVSSMRIIFPGNNECLCVRP